MISLKKIVKCFSCILSLLQHTSFLWNLDSDAITKYLSIPEKRPAYRKDRPHSEFLCPLSPAFPSLPENEIDYRFEDTIVNQLHRWFQVSHIDFTNENLQELLKSVPSESLGSKILNIEHVLPKHLSSQKDFIPTN